MNTFSLEIMTPDAIIFSGKVESLIVPRPDGLEGYLANHESVLDELVDGVVEFRGHELAVPENQNPNFPINRNPEIGSLKVNISGGFISFGNNKAIVFVR